MAGALIYFDVGDSGADHRLTHGALEHLLADMVPAHCA
jgi:hypothetical protein